MTMREYVTDNITTICHIYLAELLQELNKWYMQNT